MSSASATLIVYLRFAVSIVKMKYSCAFNLNVGYVSISLVEKEIRLDHDK